MFLDKILKYGKYLPFLNSINNINSMEKTFNKKNDIDNIQSNYIFQKVFSYVDDLNALRIVKYNKCAQKKLNITKETFQFVNIKEKSNNLTENGIKRLLKLKNNNLNDNEKDKIIVKILETFSENTKLGVDKNCTANISVHRNLIPDNGKFLHKYRNLTELTFKYFPNNITTYSNYFQNFANLKKLDLSGFITSKFISMQNMFDKCYNLEYVNLGKFITSNVTDMSGMFKGCSNLKTIIGLENFNTSNVTNMSRMFYKCYNLEYVNLRKFITSNVTDMSHMFEGCINLKIIKGLENFNTSNVIDMSYMFAGCHNLETINLRNFNTSKVTNLSSMFFECINLKNLDLSGLDTSNVTDMSYMLSRCENLKDMNISNFDVTNVKNVKSMFKDCRNLKNLHFPNFNFSNENLDFTNMLSNTQLNENTLNINGNNKNIKDSLINNNNSADPNQLAPFWLHYTNQYNVYEENPDDYSEQSLYNVNINNNTLDNPDCKLESEDENDFMSVTLASFF